MSDDTWADLVGVGIVIVGVVVFWTLGNWRNNARHG